MENLLKVLLAKIRRSESFKNSIAKEMKSGQEALNKNLELMTVVLKWKIPSIEKIIDFLIDNDSNITVEVPIPLNYR